MKKHHFLFFLIFSNYTVYSQKGVGHAHNDYEHSRPFYEAFELGFESIEVDVWLKDNDIYVAHDFNKIKSDRTFQTLYLLPMLAEMTKNINKKRKLLLLIDIKANHEKVIPMLIKKLEPYKKYLNKKQAKSGITIALSGDRPKPEKYSDYPKYIFFDGRFGENFSRKIDKKIALISDSQSNFGHLEQKDSLKQIIIEEKIKSFIFKAQTRGKKTRLWGTMNTENTFNKLQNLGLDYIGTDSLKLFRNWHQKIYE